MCDLLAVEMILKHFDWNIEDWHQIYTELPNMQVKVQVNLHSEQWL